MSTSTPTSGFVIDHNPTIDWPVTVNLPVSGGRYAEHRFTGRFFVLSEEEHIALLPKEEEPKKEAAEGEPVPQKKTPALVEALRENAELFPHFLAGWGDDVRDAQGNPVPFSTEALASQIKGPRGAALSFGLWRAIREIRFGLEPHGGATLGNSVPQPATGPASTQEAATS